MKNRYAVLLLAIWSLILSAVLYFNNAHLNAIIQEQDEKLNAETFCWENNISYPLCQTISEYTGQEQIGIAYCLKYCVQSNIPLETALFMIDPSLTETEIISILTFSDMRQTKFEDTQTAIQ